MEQRKHEASWTFRDGDLVVGAKIDYVARTYTIANEDGKPFSFVNQRLPKSKTRQVARLIEWAASRLEAELATFEPVVCTNWPISPVGGIYAKPAQCGCGGCHTNSSQAKKSNALDFSDSPSESHPWAIVTPDGETLMKTATYKAGTCDAAKALLQDDDRVPATVNLKEFLNQAGIAIPKTQVKPDASLLERLYAKERDNTIGVSVGGSLVAEVPVATDYGTPPKPDRVEEIAGSVGDHHDHGDHEAPRPEREP